MKRRVVVNERDTRRVALGMMVGNGLETYDFMLYATAAPIVFNRLFFAGHDPTVATLGAFATFAVGFAVRPLGAIIFGHVGDRIGRRRCLLITISVIGVVTGLIGVLPTYGMVGVAAPALLIALRLLQGLALGGEWAGAVTLSVEHAPTERRARYAALPQIGNPIGILLASGLFLLVSTLPQGSFDAWGWRLPFLTAFPLLYVAIWLRRRVGESPLFEHAVEAKEVVRAPVIDMAVRTFPQLLLGAALCLLHIGGYYLATTFVISYGTGTLHMSKSVLLAATMIAGIGQVFVLLLAGRLGERFGSWRIIMAGGLLTLVLAFPMFALIDTRNTVAVIIGVTVGVCALYVPLAVIGVVLADLFPVGLRYSGIGVSSNIAGVISGFIPLIATALLSATNGMSWSAALLLVVIALITTLASALAPRLAIARDEVVADKDIAEPSKVES